MDPPSTAPESERVDLSVRTDWRRFVKLDSMDRPGLTEEEFLGLFVNITVGRKREMTWI
ncbi:hypothetical protein M378DRAFT_18209 [Amanita muscaria Koide BX008]|uniref:Uncharacterized protein n=1 Tax=Amanita muscaria (strain Koide BX008) TaxID=946122 RepID=A0A0C2RXV1_AMAMK|nr:hypothetical protein M378DRAFT_18209 [Amanita muscaria Koide BX008]